MGWLGNKGVDINWDTRPVSSPVTVLSHCGEFSKVKQRLCLDSCFGQTWNISHVLRKKKPNVCLKHSKKRKYTIRLLPQYKKISFYPEFTEEQSN